MNLAPELKDGGKAVGSVTMATSNSIQEPPQYEEETSPVVCCEA